MKNFIIALGGSIAVPNGIDMSFMKKFRSFLIEEMDKGSKFIIIIGGGSVCRDYNKVASQITEVSNLNLDLMGIQSTRLNAEFLKAIFSDYTNPIILDKRMKVKEFGSYSLVIGCGWEPGHSTDFDTVQTAVDFNIKTAIILGKPDYVYTSDPEKDKNAKPIKQLNWDEYFKLVPKEWIPGLSSPVDITAAKLAKEKDIKVIVSFGGDLDNFKNILEEKDFKGTLISN